MTSKRSRRQAREVALRSLYQTEVGGSSARVALDDQLREASLTDELKEFALELVRGVTENCDEIDYVLHHSMVDWELGRLAAVDRTVLRIATFELIFLPNVPPLVSINEAIDLAKRYSTAESGKFVHGVLARVLPETGKANWVAPEVPEEVYEEEPEPEEPVEVEQLEPESPEMKELQRVGLWKIKSEADE